VSEELEASFFRIIVGAGVLVLASMVVSALAAPTLAESLFVLLVLAVALSLVGAGAWGLASALRGQG
jgi:hypothetical protein